MKFCFGSSRWLRQWLREKYGEGEKSPSWMEVSAETPFSPCTFPSISVWFLTFFTFHFLQNNRWRNLSNNDSIRGWREKIQGRGCPCLHNQGGTLQVFGLILSLPKSVACNIFQLKNKKIKNLECFNLQFNFEIIFIFRK